MKKEDKLKMLELDKISTMYSNAKNFCEINNKNLLKNLKETIITLDSKYGIKPIFGHEDIYMYTKKVDEETGDFDPNFRKIVDFCSSYVDLFEDSQDSSFYDFLINKQQENPNELREELITSAKKIRSGVLANNEGVGYSRLRADGISELYDYIFSYPYFRVAYIDKVEYLVNKQLKQHVKIKDY